MMEEKKEFLELKVEPKEEKPVEKSTQEVRLKGRAWGENAALYLTEDLPEYRKTGQYEAQIYNFKELGKTLVLNNQLFTNLVEEKLYQEMLVYPSFLTHTAPKKVLILGGETGGGLREILKLEDLESVTQVSQDQELVNFCRSHLPEIAMSSFESPKVNLIYQDIQQYLNQLTEAYDLILVDLTWTRLGNSGWDWIEDFYHKIASGLKKLGIFAVNLGGVSFPRPESGSLKKHYEAARQVFPKTVVYQELLPGISINNGFLVGSMLFSPAVLTPQEIDRRLKDRKIHDLAYYDGISHQRMFILPTSLKKLLELS